MPYAQNVDYRTPSYTSSLTAHIQCIHSREPTHTYLKRYVNTLTPANLEYYDANCLLTFVTDVNNASTWTGLWTEEQRRSLLKLIKEHPRYAGNAAQHGHKWAKASQRVLIGIGYGARQLIRHRHTKDPPPAGVGELLAALLRKESALCAHPRRDLPV